MKMMQRNLAGIKTWISIVTVVVLMSTAKMRAFAVSNQALQGFYSVTGGNPITQGGIITTIAHASTAVFGILTAAAAAWGMVFIVWAGINMIHGGALKKQEAMERVKMALLGLVVALGAGFLTGIAAFVATQF